MTAIAYRDGVLAADSLVSDGVIVCGRRSKICHGPDGSVAAATGRTVATQAFAKFFASHGIKEGFDAKTEEFEALMVSADGEISFLTDSGRLMKIDAPFHAIGSAGHFCLGAMAAGASAQQAVELATKFVITCGGPVETVSVGGPNVP